MFRETFLSPGERKRSVFPTRVFWHFVDFCAILLNKSSEAQLKVNCVSSDQGLIDFKSFCGKTVRLCWMHSIKIYLIDWTLSHCVPLKQDLLFLNLMKFFLLIENAAQSLETASNDGFNVALSDLKPHNRRVECHWFPGTSADVPEVEWKPFTRDSWASLPPTLWRCVCPFQTAFNKILNKSFH